MLPSLRLALLTAAAAPAFLVGAVFPPLQAIGAIYLLALGVYALADALLLLPRRRNFEITRTAPDRASIAVPVPIEFTISYSGRRGVRIRIAEDLPAMLRAEPPECKGTLEPGARTVLQYHLTAARRGAWRLCDADVRVLPALGLFYRQFRVKLPCEIHVYPNLVNIRRYELLLRRGMLHDAGLARLRRIGQGTEFENLRPYSQGDELARIDWKTTAKQARLIVKDYQPERQQSVLVAIDVGRATAGEFEGMSRLDYFINATLMLAYVSLRQGDWFSLEAFSDRIESYLPPIRGVRKIDQVAKALYELQPKLVESDYRMACQFLALRNRKRSLVCLMTDVIDREANRVVIEYLARFAHHHLPLAVTMSNPELIAVADERLGRTADLYGKAIAIDVLNAREEALTAMRRLGVGVLDANPHALMPDLINRYLLIKAKQRL